MIFILFFVLFFNNFFLLKDGWSALHIAAWNGFEEIVKILVEHGSNVDLQTKFSFSSFFDFHFLFLCLFFFCFCVLTKPPHFDGRNNNRHKPWPTGLFACCSGSNSFFFFFFSFSPLFFFVSLHDLRR